MTHETVTSTWSWANLLTAVGIHKRVFLATLISGVAISIGLAFCLPKQFTASTVVLPPQQQQQSAATAALAQLGALAGAVGAGAAVKTSDSMYIALMKTRRLQDALIDKFHLKARYSTDTYTSTRKEMNERISITPDKKSGLITIEVDDEDPTFAANLANAHIEQLRKMLLSIAITDAQQRRVFFEAQVTKTKESLSKAEVLFRRAQRENGLVVSQSLAESGIKEAAQIRAQIAAKEVQLQIISKFATPENNEFQRVSAELNALRQQLNKLEAGEGHAAKSAQESTVGYQAVQAFRDMKTQEAMLEVYIRQLEAARADESREGPLLQQIDVATPPERPIKPRKGLVILLGSMASLITAVFFSIGTLLVRQGTVSKQWQQIRNAWSTQ